MNPGGRSGGHDMRLEPLHLREHVIPACPDEATAVSRLLETARHVQRAQWLRAFQLLHHEENTPAHGGTISQGLAKVQQPAPFARVPTRHRRLRAKRTRSPLQTSKACVAPRVAPPIAQPPEAVVTRTPGLGSGSEASDASPASGKRGSSVSAIAARMNDPYAASRVTRENGP